MLFPQLQHCFDLDFTRHGATHDVYSFDLVIETYGLPAENV